MTPAWEPVEVALAAAEDDAEAARTALGAALGAWMRSLDPAPAWLAAAEGYLEGVLSLATPRQAVGMLRRWAWRLGAHTRAAPFTLPGSSRSDLLPRSRWALVMGLSAHEPRWEWLEAVPGERLWAGDPVSRALARAREARHNPDSLTRAGRAPLRASHRWAWERAVDTRLGVLRLAAEEAGRGLASAEESVRWLVLLSEVAEDPVLVSEHGEAARLLSSRLHGYLAEGFETLGDGVSAQEELAMAWADLDSAERSDRELTATLAALEGRRAVLAGRVGQAVRFYTSASRTVAEVEPLDRRAEVLEEAVMLLEPLGVTSAELGAALAEAVAGWSFGFRPRLRWSLASYWARALWAPVLESWTRPFAGRPLRTLTASALWPHVLPCRASLESLSSLAEDMAPWVLRYASSGMGMAQVWRWWGQGQLIEDPSEAVGLFVRSVEHLVVEGLEEACLPVLLDLVWAVVLDGSTASGEDLLLSDPLDRLLTPRPGLRRSFLELVSSYFVDPNPSRLAGVLEGSGGAAGEPEESVH